MDSGRWTGKEASTSITTTAAGAAAWIVAVLWMSVVRVEYYCTNTQHIHKPTKNMM